MPKKVETPTYTVVGSVLVMKYASHGDALAGLRMIRNAVEAAEKAKPPLQLRVGAHYKRSDGVTGRVVFRSTTSGYFLWEGTDGLRRAYNEDGTALRQFEGMKNLIEEVTPCPTIHDCRAGQVERCACCAGETGE